MKKTAKILALLLLAVTTMVSCTKNNSSNDGNQSANLIVGKWKCVSYNSNSHNIPDVVAGVPLEWSKVGDFWSFSNDGTLDFKMYSRHDEPSFKTIPISAHYIISEKWLTFFSNQLQTIATTAATVSFEITEISSDKLILDCQTGYIPAEYIEYAGYVFHYHIEFEKEE